MAVLDIREKAKNNYLRSKVVIGGELKSEFGVVSVGGVVVCSIPKGVHCTSVIVQNDNAEDVTVKVEIDNGITVTEIKASGVVANNTTVATAMNLLAQSDYKVILTPTSEIAYGRIAVGIEMLDFDRVEHGRIADGIE